MYLAATRSGKPRPRAGDATGACYCPLAGAALPLKIPFFYSLLLAKLIYTFFVPASIKIMQSAGFKEESDEGVDPLLFMFRQYQEPGGTCAKHRGGL
jgi:hypothetical protein